MAQEIVDEGVFDERGIGRISAHIGHGTLAVVQVP